MRRRHEREDTAAALHALDVVDCGSSVWLMRPSGPAVVLGSGQADDAVLDEAALARRGVERARRRSGGGLVRVDPHHTRWVDVVIAHDDPAFDPDVHRAARWLGARWVDALAAVDLVAEVHAGPMEDPESGRAVCFAGIGAGEVTVAGRKVVGISQRRDRRGARFQCVAYTAWRPEELLDVLGPALAPRAEVLGSRLARAAGAVGPGLDAAVDAFVEALVGSGR